VRAADPPNLIWVMPAEERVEHELVVVVAGGDATRSAVAVPAGTPVIAADGGLDRAFALGLDVQLAVGDFDSATPGAVAAAEAAGVRLVRHPRAKDATDLELALDTAAALQPRRILVVGSDGGRLDHLLAGLLLLGSERYAAFEVDAALGRATAHVVRRERRLAGAPGELVTLLALHGPAEGVVAEGVAFPLCGETLEPGSSRGVSNVFVSGQARIAVASGTLLVLRPGLVEEGAPS
jgi:thiamine pyrophosphokinase